MRPLLNDVISLLSALAFPVINIIQTCKKYFLCLGKTMTTTCIKRAFYYQNYFLKNTISSSDCSGNFQEMVCNQH